MGVRADKKHKPTQFDVALRAGVSRTTVSHVLTNNPAIAIPQETRQRIMDAVEELGYVPNSAARSLRTSKTHTIATIIPDITNPFYPALQRGIQDVVGQAGYDLIMYNTDGLAEQERRCLRSAYQGRVDGVITVLFHIQLAELVPLVERNIAVTSLQGNGIPAIPIDCLYVDNVAAARTAVSYLLGRGHTRIGMIAGLTATPQRSARIQGYRAALLEHHVALDEFLVQDGDFTEKGGYQGMRSLLELSPRPTAVFAANDLMAIGALKAIREAGLRIPEDMAVVGFDDIPVAELITPQLTTITQFQEQLGRRAARMLLERLDGSAPAEGRCETMPFELVVRESA